MPEIPAHELTAMTNRLAHLEAANAQAESARQTAEAQRLIASGQSEAVLKQHRDQLTAANERGAKLAISGEVSRALTGHSLISEHAASQLAELLSKGLVADQSPSGYTVRTADYRSTADHVRAKLADPLYAHFLASGKTAPATPSAPATPGAAALPGFPAQPRTVGEAIIMNAAASQAAVSDRDPRMDPTQAMGLPKSARTGHVIPGLGGLMWR